MFVAADGDSEGLEIDELNVQQECQVEHLVSSRPFADRYAPHFFEVWLQTSKIQQWCMGTQGICTLE